MKFKLTRCLSIIALILVIVELFFRMSLTLGEHFILTGTSLAIILIAIVNVMTHIKK